MRPRSRADHLEVYVFNELDYHIKGCFLGMDEPDIAFLEPWINDQVHGYQDAIPRGVGRLIGYERMATLAEADEAAGKWWHAALKYAVASIVGLEMKGSMVKVEYIRAAGLTSIIEKAS